MGLISKTVMVKWNNATKRHYEKLGYKYTSQGDLFEVKVEDLPKGSGVVVDCICDGCGCELHWKYQSYNRYVKNNNETYCVKCGYKSYGKENAIKSRTRLSKTFKQWCVENNEKNVLERWDYELNGCSPDEITYASDKRCWFKCNKHPEHKSELKHISSLTRNKNCNFECKQCNSIAQYILDNFPSNNLEDIWDYEKNKNINPWNIDHCSNKKYWIKCLKKDYHDSYEVECNDFVNGYRCPYCRGLKVHPLDSFGQYVTDNYNDNYLWCIWSNKNKKSPFKYSKESHYKVWWKCPIGKHKDFKRSIQNSNKTNLRCPQCTKERTESILEEKVRLYLESLGYTVLHEHNCTIRPRNPKTGYNMPFDNEIKELRLIIEVHGGQHYDSNFFKTIQKCSEEESERRLHYLQIKDRYKKIYAIQNGYYYLDIPFWKIVNSNAYKQLIDDKIKEILNKNY